MASTINGTSTGNGGLISTGDDSGILNIQTNETTAITVDASQRVGIGTASPNDVLEVAGNDAYIRVNRTGNEPGILLTYSNSGTNRGNIAVTSGGAMYFTSGGNTERMRIDSSGNLLVGQSSSSFGGGICLTKNAQDSIAIFQNSTSTSGGQCIRGILGANNNNTSSYLFVGSAASQDNIYIYGNGNVVNRNNSYGSLSDIKLKENVVDASPKLADVMQLKVRNFNFKTDPDSKQIGFIAQEFEEVFPSLIDSTTSPNDPDDVTKAIKTSVLVPILVKAIQELKAINDTQAETINALTARLVALETA